MLAPAEPLGACPILCSAGLRGTLLACLGIRISRYSATSLRCCQKYQSTFVAQVPPEKQKMPGPTPPLGPRAPTFPQCQFVTGLNWLVPGAWGVLALALAHSLHSSFCRPCHALPCPALACTGLFPVANNFPAMPLGQAGGQAG